MPTKHIVVVHGRATKPRKAEKRRLVKWALVEGLTRVDQAAAAAVEREEVKLTLAYYGDRNNMLLVKAGKVEVADMVQEPPPDESTARDAVYYERDGSYDDDLRKVIERPTDQHTREAYKAVLNEVKDLRAVDDIVAHDGDMADDFRRMGPGTPSNVQIDDRRRIYNFWVGRDGSNPHKLYGYLNHPSVASELAAWIKKP